VAARQAAPPHPESLPGAVALHCLVHVIRTGRIETAGRGKKGGNGKLVYLKRPELHALSKHAVQDAIQEAAAVAVDRIEIVRVAVKENLRAVSGHTLAPVRRRS